MQLSSFNPHFPFPETSTHSSSSDLTFLPIQPGPHNQPPQQASHKSPTTFQLVCKSPTPWQNPTPGTKLSVPILSTVGWKTQKQTKCVCWHLNSDGASMLFSSHFFPRMNPQYNPSGCFPKPLTLVKPLILQPLRRQIHHHPAENRSLCTILFTLSYFFPPSFLLLSSLISEINTSFFLKPASLPIESIPFHLF